MAEDKKDDKPKDDTPYNPYDSPPFYNSYNNPNYKSSSDDNGNYTGQDIETIVEAKNKQKDHELANYKDKTIFDSEFGLKSLGINTGIFAGVGLLAGCAFGAMAGKGVKGKLGKGAGYGALGAALFSGVGLLMGR